MDIIWYMFDMIGTIAFAVSGALVGVSRKMDIFGMAVLALATAISYLFADALGLASFTVTGASAGYTLYPDLPIFIVLLGTITAVGGGILRDMLAQRVPSVLKEDVYALPSIIGGIAYYLLVISDWAGQAVYGAFTIVLVIRLLAIKYHWSLPRVR